VLVPNPNSEDATDAVRIEGMLAEPAVRLTRRDMSWSSRTGSIVTESTDDLTSNEADEAGFSRGKVSEPGSSVTEARGSIAQSLDSMTSAISSVSKADVRRLGRARALVPVVTDEV
jgi:hypothetical protein